jgi:hypothetical protein
MFPIVIPLRNCKLRGRLHGALSTPGLNSALLKLTEMNFFFPITWTISNGWNALCSRHWFPEVKKPPLCLLVINSHYHTCSNNSWIISALGWNDYMTKLSTRGWNFNHASLRIWFWSSLVLQTGLKFEHGEHGWV